jgi:hypothetical protein
MVLEQFENAQINAAISSGSTPQELAHGGMTSAVNPAVLE